MDGSRAEKDHRRRVGKNWLMTGFWKTRSTAESWGLGECDRLAWRLSELPKLGFGHPSPPELALCLVHTVG